MMMKGDIANLSLSSKHPVTEVEAMLMPRVIGRLGIGCWDMERKTWQRGVSNSHMLESGLADKAQYDMYPLA